MQRAQSVLLLFRASITALSPPSPVSLLQPPLLAPDNGAVSAAALETKERTLISCALFVASFLRWDLAAFELRLAPAVLYSLLSLLTRAHPLAADAPLSSASPVSLTANTLYHLWAVRYLANRDCHMALWPLAKSSRRNGGGTLEVNCASPDFIYSTVG